MMAAELAACRVPEDPAFLAPAEGYVVSFMAFYDASAPLSVFTGSCPASMPSWGDGLAGKVVALVRGPSVVATGGVDGGAPFADLL
jgi:hypothetical protein